MEGNKSLPIIPQHEDLAGERTLGFLKNEYLKRFESNFPLTPQAYSDIATRDKELHSVVITIKKITELNNQFYDTTKNVYKKILNAKAKEMQHQSDIAYINPKDPTDPANNAYINYHPALDDGSFRLSLEPDLRHIYTTMDEIYINYLALNCKQSNPKSSEREHILQKEFTEIEKIVISTRKKQSCYLGTWKIKKYTYNYTDKNLIENDPLSVVPEWYNPRIRQWIAFIISKTIDTNGEINKQETNNCIHLRYGKNNWFLHISNDIKIEAKHYGLFFKYLPKNAFSNFYETTIQNNIFKDPEEKYWQDLFQKNKK